MENPLSVVPHPFPKVRPPTLNWNPERRLYLEEKFDVRSQRQFLPHNGENISDGYLRALSWDMNRFKEFRHGASLSPNLGPWNKWDISFDLEDKLLRSEKKPVLYVIIYDSSINCKNSKEFLVNGFMFAP